MFGVRERPYPGRVLISFWCDSDNNNFLSRSIILADFSVLLILAIFKIWHRPYSLTYAQIISKYLQYAY